MIWRPILRTGGAGLRVGYRTFHQSVRILAEALRDEAIAARYVRLVDVETGSLSDRVERVSNLLKNMDRSRFWLVQVKAGKLDGEIAFSSQGAAGAAGAGAGNSKTPWQQPRLNEQREAARQRELLEAELPVEELAIVKMINKKEAYNKLKEKKLEKRQGGGKSVANTGGAAAHKGVDLTWSSTTHDIEHKLKTLVTHFKKKGPGAKGTVDVNAKSGKGRFGGANEEQKKEMLRKMEEYLCNWESVNQEESAAQEELFHARRAGEIERRSEGSQATLRIEVVKGRRKPPPST